MSAADRIAELEQMGVEHDRYREALVRISDAESGVWGRIAHAALHPNHEGVTADQVEVLSKAALTSTPLGEDQLRADRDRWVRLFNRLQGAIQHHRDADRFKDDHDEALYAAMDRVLRDAANTDQEVTP